MDILDKISRGIVVFDGAMGTMLQKHLSMGDLPESLNLTNPDAVKTVHLAYLSAGCDVVETNTLNANRRKLEKAGMRVDEVISAAVKCAKDAIAESGKEGCVALSMGSLGVMLEPLGDMSFEEAFDMYREMAEAGARAGADMILIETVSDLYEIKTALLAAKSASKLPVGVTMTFMANGRLLTGADVTTAAAALTALGADILGFNCGLGPSQMLDLLDDLKNATDLPLLINPNAGLPRLVGGKTVYAVEPEEFAEGAKKLVEGGAALIGGCCGTTPEHIKALRAAVEGMPPAKTRECGRFILTSGSKLTGLSGEVFEAELISGDDEEDLADSALDCETAAICVRFSPLAAAVKSIQETVLKPMVLLSDDAGELERASRIYNGRPMIGKACADNLTEISAIAKRNGAAILYEGAENAADAEAVLKKSGLPRSCVCFLAENGEKAAEDIARAGYFSAIFNANMLKTL